MKYPSWFAPWRLDQAGRSGQLAGDLSAGLIVTLMLIPQSLAYALLAGLPAHIGLYASVLPLIGYAIFGRSPALAVGPVAISAVMTFEALRPFAQPGSVEWIAGAMFLAVVGGVLLIAMGLLRLGFLAQLLSHPVMSGFVTGAAVIIILGQIKSLTGIAMDGETALELVETFIAHAGDYKPVTVIVGLLSLAGLLVARMYAGPVFKALGAKGLVYTLLVKSSPLMILMVATIVLVLTGAEGQTKTVGVIPQGLPELAIPSIPANEIEALVISSILIALVGFIETVSMAQAIGRKMKVPVDPNAELRGLGAANVLSGVSGAFPVTGGLSRSVVNMEAGAMTPMAGVYSAILMVGVMLGAGVLLEHLPLASLAALIIVSVSSLLDWETFRRAWAFDKADGLTWMLTFLGVLLLGVEAGILTGIVLSVGTILWRMSRPHIAVIGRIAGTEHFRNVHRHEVETLPGVLFLRTDANLFFGNWLMVQEMVESEMAKHGSPVRAVVLSLSSVNDIDSTALDGLLDIRRVLEAREVRLMLTELKGPVADKLARDPEARDLEVRLSNQQAFEELRAA